MRKVGVLYVTFARDIKWLDYSLQSFRKFASGFSGVTIVVPTRDVQAFLPFEEKFSTPDCPVLIKNFLEYPEKGFVHHLAMKCYADVFMPDMTHILHMDPDCLWHAPVRPDDYFINDKPVLLIEPFDAILKAKHHPRYNWKFVVEMALRFDVEYETMCRHPAVHYAETYGLVRNHIEAAHLTPFIDFVLKQKNSFPQGFAEYPTLGAFAISKMPEKYFFVDRGYDGEKNDPTPLLTQFWSYHGADRRDNQERINKILGK